VIAAEDLREPMVTAAEAERLAGVGAMTLRREVKAGKLRQPPPELRYSNGRRVFLERDVLAWKAERAARPHRAIPSSSAGRARAHSLRDEFTELKAAAAEALACAGVAEIGRTLAKHTASGRLTEIPVNGRRLAILDLRRLVERFA